MGLTQKLIETFGVPAILTTLREKDPHLVELVDRLDEVSLPEAIGGYLQARHNLPAEEKTGAEIDWLAHAVNLLRSQPALPAIIAILTDLGIAEISGVNIATIVQEMAGYGD